MGLTINDKFIPDSQLVRLCEYAKYLYNPKVWWTIKDLIMKEQIGYGMAPDSDDVLSEEQRPSHDECMKVYLRKTPYNEWMGKLFETKDEHITTCALLIKDLMPYVTIDPVTMGQYHQSWEQIQEVNFALMAIFKKNDATGMKLITTKNRICDDVLVAGLIYFLKNPQIQLSELLIQQLTPFYGAKLKRPDVVLEIKHNLNKPVLLETYDCGITKQQEVVELNSKYAKFMQSGKLILEGPLLLKTLDNGHQLSDYKEKKFTKDKSHISLQSNLDRVTLMACKDNLVIGANGLPLIDGYYMYTISADFRFRYLPAACDVGEGGMNKCFAQFAPHTTLTDSQPVIAAGNFEISGSKFKWIDNGSGHYRMPYAFNRQATDAVLKYLGYDIHKDDYFDRMEDTSVGVYGKNGFLVAFEETFKAPRPVHNDYITDILTLLN